MTVAMRQRALLNKTYSDTNGCEAWTKLILKKKEAVEMWIWRRLLMIPWKAKWKKWNKEGH